MMPLRPSTKRALALVVVYCLFPRTASAYVDPGTGSLVIQLIVASLLGASLALKMYWKKGKALVTNLLSKPKEENEAARDS